MDIKQYLDSEFPELKCEVCEDEDQLATRVRIRYQLGFEVPWYAKMEADEMHVRELLLGSLYKAIGNLTLMAVKIRGGQ